MRPLEGQVRIPSGCAISAVISREGRRMSGRDIIESMKPMHERSNGLGAALPVTASIRNTGTTLPCTSFSGTGPPARNARRF